MKKIVLALAFLSTLVLAGQNQGSISGKILDLEVNGEPLPFANVDLKNTQFKTHTNLHGNFELVNVYPGTYTLVVSFLGYKTVELPIEIKAGQTIKIYKGLKAKMLNASDALTMAGGQSTGATDDHTLEDN